LPILLHLSLRLLAEGTHDPLIYEEEIDASVLEALGWRATIDLEDGLRGLHKHMSAGDDKHPIAEAYK
jgi:hypothetical protein